MGGRPARLGAAALVDGDIDDHRALLHRLTMLRVISLGAAAPGMQHGADDEIGALHQRSSIASRVENRCAPRAELLVEIACSASAIRRAR